MLKKLLLAIALIVGFLLFYFALFPLDQNQVVKKPAPLFTAQGPQGVYDLTQSKGKVVLLNIWATWCAPCREEIPLLNQVASEIQNHDFEIVALMEDEAEDFDSRKVLLENFSKRIPISFSVYFDPDGSIADNYGTFQIPETYLINKQGVIVYKHAGPLTKWDKKALTDLIEATINQDS